MMKGRLNNKQIIGFKTQNHIYYMNEQYMIITSNSCNFIWMKYVTIEVLKKGQQAMIVLADGRELVTSTVEKIYYV